MDTGKLVHLARIARAKIEHTGLIAANDAGCLDADHWHGESYAAGEVASTRDRADLFGSHPAVRTPAFPSVARKPQNFSSGS